MLAASALLLAQALPPLPPLPPARDLDAELATLVAEWTGDYANAPGDPARSATVRPIAVPRIARRAVFVEVRDGAGAIVFQRIIAFRDQPGRTANIAASYYFADPAAYARLDRQPARAAAIGPDDIRVFDPTPGVCAIHVFPEPDGGYALSAHKDQCRIVSRMRPGFVFHPEFRLTVGGGRFGFSEQAFLENGRPFMPAYAYTLVKRP